MKKRFLSILLTLVMVIGMLPAASLTAHAAGTTVTVNSWDSLKTALEELGDATVVVDSDITTTLDFASASEYHGSYIYVKGNKTLQLDEDIKLTIKNLVKDSGWDFSGVIEVENGASLTIEGPGSFLCGAGEVLDTTNGLDAAEPVVVSVGFNGTFIMNGGTIGGSPDLIGASKTGWGYETCFGALRVHENSAKVTIDGGVLQGVAHGYKSHVITEVVTNTGSFSRLDHYGYGVINVTGTPTVTINGGEIKSIYYADDSESSNSMGTKVSQMLWLSDGMTLKQEEDYIRNTNQFIIYENLVDEIEAGWGGITINGGTFTAEKSDGWHEKYSPKTFVEAFLVNPLKASLGSDCTTYTSVDDDSATVIVNPTSLLAFTDQVPAGNTTATVGDSVTYKFDNADVPAGFTVVKSGSLAAPGVNVEFSDDPATLTHTYTKSGLYTLTETLTLKKGETTVATKQNVFYVTVSPAPTYEVTVSAEPTDGGTVTGGNTYEAGASATVRATAKPGYQFVGWKENGTTVTTDRTYTFVVDEDRSLVAEFEALPKINSVSANVKVPVAGQYPDTAVNNVIVNGEGYTVTAVDWYSGDSTFSDIFANDETYVCVLTFAPETGYAFGELADFSATINGKPADWGLLSANSVKAEIELAVSAGRINSVTVTPATAEVEKGETQQFDEEVTFVSLPNKEDRAVVWSVSGGTDSSIDRNGLLSVGADETANTLIVTATSVFDPSKSASATVTVTESTHEHIYDDTFNGSNDTYHWKECTADNCPAADKGRQNAAAHVWDFENPEDSATCENDGQLTLKCSVCENTAKLYSPAKGHDWNQWPAYQVPPCTSPALTITRTCKNDSEHTESRTIKPIHFASEWTQESDGHLKICEYCGEEILVEKMPHADTDTDNKCDTCGYDMTPAVQPTEITDVNATVAEPVVGGTPSTTAATTGTDYTVFVSGWYDEEENTVSVFEAGKTYSLEVGFTPKEGYVLAGSNTLNATINDKEAEYLSLDIINGTVTCFIRYTIPAVVPTEITDVNATVAEPVVGGTPSTTAATTGTDYTVFVSGWYDEEENTVSVFEAGKTYSLEVGFTPKEGYVLAGSNTLNATINDKEAEYLSLDIINGTVTCFIRYTIPAVVPTEYDITVTGGTASANKAVAGTVITLTVDESAIPAGKVFDKWIVSGAVPANANNAITTFTMPASNVTAEATYKNAPVVPVTYTITFDANGGSVSPASKETGTDGKLDSLPTPTHSGSYSFDGWYSAKNGGTKITTSTVFTTDTTVYAHWTYTGGGGIVIPTVFPVNVKDSDNGEVKASAKYAAPGSTIKLTVTPDEGYELDTLTVKSGSKFIDVTEKNGKYQFVMPFGSVTVTATFKAVNPYNDVDTDDWFYDDVLYVTLKDLMNGTGNGKFSPEITTDRAMLVTVLWRLEGCPVVDSPVAFDDVADGLWYSDAIDWASANGIVNGYGDGKFGPTDQITREQIMAILNRYAAYKNWTDGTALPMIPQYNCSIWAENNVIWADMNGLLNGLGVDITDMTAKASRAELAAYLARFYKAFAEN